GDPARAERERAARGEVSYTAARDAGWSSQVARRAHNPEVAGSNPAPATTKALLSGAFCLQDRRDDGAFTPLFIPIAKVRHGETVRFRALTLSPLAMLRSRTGVADAGLRSR